MCHQWWICSVCGNHYPFLSVFMTYHRVSNKSNTKGATRGADSAYPSGAPALTFEWSSCYPIFSFMCNVLKIVVQPFVLFPLSIALFVGLRFTASNKSTSTFNLMLYLFQEDCKQPEGYTVDLLSIRMIQTLYTSQDKAIQQTISHSFTHNS